MQITEHRWNPEPSSVQRSTRSRLLFIGSFTKDEDYDASKDKDAWNFVRISVLTNGKGIEDIPEDIYVTDGSLYKELERIHDHDYDKDIWVFTNDQLQ